MFYLRKMTYFVHQLRKSKLGVTLQRATFSGDAPCSKAFEHPFNAFTTYCEALLSLWLLLAFGCFEFLNSNDSVYVKRFEACFSNGMS